MASNHYTPELDVTNDSLLAALVELQHMLLADVQDEPFFREILELLSEVTGASLACYYEQTGLETETPSMLRRAQWRDRETVWRWEFPPEVLFGPTNLIWREALKNGENFWGTAGHILPSREPRIGEEDEIAVLLVPVRGEGQLRGVLAFVPERAALREKSIAVGFLRAAASALAMALARRQAERLLRDMHQRLERVLESITDAFIALNRQWKFTYVNREAAQLLKRERAALLGRILWPELPDWSGSPLGMRLLEVMRSGAAAHFENYFPETRAWWEVHVFPSPDGISVYFRDVTIQKQTEAGRRRVEDQLQQVRRMDFVRQLAGGLAHDLNNKLTVVQTCAGVLAETPALPEETQSYVKELGRAAEQLSLSVEQLWSLSGQHVVQLHPLNLNDVVQKTLAAFLLPAEGGARLEFNPTQVLPLTLADEGKLTELLRHLWQNAVEAMPKGGSIMVTTRVVEWGEFDLIGRPQARAGQWICVEVWDEGLGLTEEAQTRLFEPFYTTKSTEEHPGLGLSVAYGIVKQHQGWMEVMSEAGQGTRVFIYLPVWEGARPVTTVPEKAGDSAAKTVLWVEDSDMVRRVVQRILLNAGYRVLEAPDVEQALVCWKQAEGAVDLLLTDILLPGKYNGWQLSAKLRKEKPNLPVIFTSGYGQKALQVSRKLPAHSLFLPKPYEPKILLEKIKTLLEGTKEPSLVKSERNDMRK